MCLFLSKFGFLNNSVVSIMQICCKKRGRYALTASKNTVPEMCGLYK